MFAPLQDGEAFHNGDCALIKLSLFQNGFICSQNTLTASPKFKHLSLENHLLVDGDWEGKERVTADVGQGGDGLDGL